MTDKFEVINEAKSNLDHIYNLPDPREYFLELSKLNYAIPGHAKPIFQKLIAHLRRRRNPPLHVLDIGCSYGVNAALLRHDLTLRDLYEHWGNYAIRNSTTSDVISQDKMFFGNLENVANLKVTGLDQANPAVAFAVEVGLIDEGLPIDLEVEPLPVAAEKNLASVDLVTSTGAVGYLTEKSFGELLPAMTECQEPWLANFVLRVFPFDAIASKLREYGYVTEKLEGRKFVQRNFVSSLEKANLLEQLRKIGVDPENLEADGHLLAEFYLSRPAREAAEFPIEQLLAA